MSRDQGVLLLMLSTVLNLVEAQLIVGMTAAALVAVAIGVAVAGTRGQ